jgi:uncharacterized protein with von Willebrand factor type A (vWA) domain
VLAGRVEEAGRFDAAFDRFFLAGFGAGRAGPGVSPGADAPLPPADSHAVGEAGRPAAAGGGDEVADSGTGAGAGAIQTLAEAGEAAPAGVLRATYSPLAGEGAVPDLEPADREWLAAAAALAGCIHARMSRRWRPAPHGQRFDFRRTLRSSLHTGGVIVTPRWRARRRRAPHFVVLVDGSRSMGPSSWPALRLAVALTEVVPDTETFTFSTELRRVSPDVRRAAAGERRPLHLHRAWGGGTTIGACVDEFLRVAGRLLRRDTVVIVASDGLDVGDQGLLRASMAALHRQSAAVLWLNPLAATPGYEPTAAGMRLARPFVSVLAAANDPPAVRKLASTLRVRR